MTDYAEFGVDDGFLIISDDPANKARWHGHPQRAPISDIKTIPGAVDVIILLDYSAQPNGQFPNLLRVSPGGAIIWIAELPTGSNTDSYVAFDLCPSSVRANSWSGWAVTIDTSSGSIMTKSFAK